MDQMKAKSINDATPAQWDRASASLDAPDMVNRPPHYTVGPTEVIDIIRQQQGSAVEFHYEAALLKYVLRWRYKNGIEDLKKAKVYLDWLIDHKQQGG